MNNIFSTILMEIADNDYKYKCILIAVMLHGNK